MKPLTYTGINMDERLDVLRLGYRKGRDPRITTHLALVSRAFGADGFMLSGDEDKELFSNLKSVSDRFGGSLDTNHVKGMSTLKQHVASGGVAVHLTMYGEPYRKAIPTIRRDKPLMVIVGGAKVPGDVYKLCQHNVAVGNQPHSEVAALALFLEAWFGDARLVIEGTNKGKIVHEIE